MRLIDELRQDARYAARLLRRSPGFTAVAACTLALGIGANSAVFSVVDAVLLRPLPYREPNRLLVLSSDAGDPAGGLTYEAYHAVLARSRAFADVAVYYRNTGWSRVTLTGGCAAAGCEPEAVQGAFVSGSFFRVMGIAPAVGRWVGPDDERRGERVVVLGQTLAARRFGGAREALGRTLEIDGVGARVIGVMPATYQFPARETQLWAPITTNRFWRERPADSPGRSRGFYARWSAVGRLASGVPPSRARAELATIARGLERADDAGLYAHPLRVQPAGSMRLALLVLFGAVCVVLLVACANLANLLLARGAARQREMALRVALGAGRGRLVRQLLIESAALAGLGGALGLAIAVVGLDALVAAGPRDVPRLEQARVDGWVLAFTCGVSLLATALFGLAPAWALSRRDPGEVLRAGGRGASAGAALRRTRKALVVAELALALMLLTGAGLLTRSLLAAGAVDPGFRAERVLTLQVAWPAGIPPARRVQHGEAVLERLRSLPGVRAAGAINGLFELGGASTLGLRSVEGRDPEPRERWTVLTWKTVSDDYFHAMGVRLIRGRLFSAQDGAMDPQAGTPPPVAVIDDATARRYWPGEDPIGKRFKGQDPRGRNDEWVTVIGLVNDTHRQGLERPAAPTIYQSYRQSGDVMPDILVRTVGEPRALAAAIRRAARAVDPTAVVSAVTLLERQLSDQLAPRRFQTSLLALFSILALLLASLGIYGVIHFSVAQRTREIGIRVALGARPARVLGMVLGEAAWLALVGLAAGLFASWWLTKLLTNLLFGVRPDDPLTFAAASGVLAAVALLASYIPARRAMRVDPVVALRGD